MNKKEPLSQYSLTTKTYTFGGICVLWTAVFIAILMAIFKGSVVAIFSALVIYVLSMCLFLFFFVKYVSLPLNRNVMPINMKKI